MEEKKPLVDELLTLITAPVRDSVTRALGRATKPVHARIDRALDQAVRRLAGPVHARVDKAVAKVADEAVDKIVERIRPGRR